MTPLKKAPLLAVLSLAATALLPQAAQAHSRWSGVAHRPVIHHAPVVVYHSPYSHIRLGSGGVSVVIDSRVPRQVIHHYGRHPGYGYGHGYRHHASDRHDRYDRRHDRREDRRDWRDDRRDWRDDRRHR